MTANRDNAILDRYLLHRDCQQFREDIRGSHLRTDDICGILDEAVARSDLGAVTILLEFCDVRIPWDDNGFTLLHSAIDALFEAGQESSARKDAALQILELLLTRGANPNVFGISGGTPLHRAAGWGLIPAAQLLLNHGAQIDVRALVDGDFTPLMHAAAMGQPEMVRFLLAGGADPTLRSAKYDGARSLPEIVTENKHPGYSEILEILRHANANPGSE